MANRALLISAFTALIAIGIATAQATPGANGDRVAGLIQKLGSDNFAERERAKAELEKLGASALEALSKAAESDDLETSRRASDLVRKIKDKTENESILAPKTIHLKLKDVSVLDAIRELEKQSGYPVQVGGNQPALKDRKITLDTGATTFWQAFDQLCRTAGLVETQTQVATPQVPIGVSQPIIRNRIQIQPQVLPVPNPQKVPVLPIQNQQNGAAPQLQAVVPVVPILPANGVKPVQAKAIQVIQAAQAAQMAQLQQAMAQIQINQGLVPAGTRPGQVKAGIAVADGTPKSVPTSYSGAVRVRLLPATAEQRRAAQPGELVFLLDVDAEPRLQNFTLAATPQIEKAVDDQGQSLQIAMDTDANPNVQNANVNGIAINRLLIARNGYQQLRQQALIRFKAGEKPSKVITELTGAVSAQALTTTEPVVTVKDILKAAGKSEKANGYSMQVNSVEKLANGDVKIDVSLESNGGQNVPGVQIFQGGGIQIQGNVQINGNVVFSSTSNNNGGMPALVDVNGKSFRLSSTPSRRLTINNGRIISQLTLQYSPGPGQAEADRLVLSGQRTATFQVPFSFKDVAVE